MTKQILFYFFITLICVWQVQASSKHADKKIMSSSKVPVAHQEIYELAAQHAETLKSVKCHCGCMKNPTNHKGLHTCFETDHGTHCKMCQDEVRRVAKFKEQGKTDKEIATLIDGEFK